MAGAAARRNAVLGVFWICTGTCKVHSLIAPPFRWSSRNVKPRGCTTKTTGGQSWGRPHVLRSSCNGAADYHDPPITDASTPTDEKQRWIVCPSTNDLEEAVRRWIRPSDSVTELGAQLRSVSNAILESVDASQGGTAFLIDVARKLPAATNSLPHRTRAMRQQSQPDVHLPDHATFVELDRLEGWRRALLHRGGAWPNYQFDVLVLDLNAITGNDLEWTALSLVQEFTALFPQCRIVLIKSARLNQWASRLVHFQRWKDAAAAHSGGATEASPLWSLIPPPHVVATVGVHEYRQTIPFAVHPGDAVLEVGCHLGTTAQLLHSRASSGPAEGGFCVGVDVGPKIVAQARERYPNVTFAVGDAWNTGDLLRLRSRSNHYEASPRHGQQGWDVVYVDVGGLSGRDGLLEAIMLVSSLSQALQPRCIVVKSLCLQRLASVLHPYWRAKGSHVAG